MRNNTGFNFLTKKKHYADEVTIKLDHGGFDVDENLSQDAYAVQVYKDNMYDYLSTKIDLKRNRRRCSTDNFILYYEHCKEMNPAIKPSHIFVELALYFGDKLLKLMTDMPDYIQKEIEVYDELQGNK